MKTSNSPLHASDSPLHASDSPLQASDSSLRASNSPLVSVITVVYNGEAHIEQSIKSVLDQTYDNIEYIVIDGASTDSTLDIVKKYESVITKLVSEKDSGIYNAMNKGLNMVTGEIVAILNADDYYYPETIQQVVKQFEDSEADVVYGNLTKLRQIGDKEFFKEVQPNIELMEQTMPIFHPATFVKKKVYDQLGGFNETYRLSSDYDFIYRVYKAGFQFEYLPKVLTVFRIGGATAVDCKTYEEGYRILKANDSPHAHEMKQLISKCKRKNNIRRIADVFIRLFGLKKWNEKRLMKKWG